MVLVHDTSSECALQMYEVLLKYHKRLSSYRAARNSISHGQRYNSKNIQSRVMVLVHDKLSYCALGLFDVSTK